MTSRFRKDALQCDGQKGRRKHAALARTAPRGKNIDMRTVI